MSAAPLTTCPACGQETYAKQVTAAGFQLKGSGWYVTDFRDNTKKTGEGAAASSTTSASAAATDTKTETTKSEPKPNTPAPAAAATPANTD